MKILLLGLFALFLTGCNSTPKRDDYAKYVNNVNTAGIEANDITFTLVGAKTVDMRGMHKRDDTASQSPILYQGGAGVIGLVAQIGIHASMIQSQRNEQLSQKQKEANALVAPIIDIASAYSLDSLTDEFTVSPTDKNANQTLALKVKPIFYSSSDMDQIQLKLVTWLPKKSGKRTAKKKNQYRYRNLVQIYSQVFNEEEKRRLLDKDDEFLKSTLATLLNTSLDVVQKDFVGQYAKKKASSQTFLLEENSATKVVRGSIVETTCDFNVIKDLRSWLIVIPADEDSAVIPETSCES